MTLDKFIQEQNDKSVNLSDRELIILNNKLINRLIMEVHYLTNEVLEVRTILQGIKTYAPKHGA